MPEVRLRVATVVATLGMFSGLAASAPCEKDDDCTAKSLFAWCVLSLFGSVNSFMISSVARRLRQLFDATHWRT